MAQYYAQRASAGLIIAEATVIARTGIGYADTPGIWSREQAEGWKVITHAVHERGGSIFLQLWHVGRISHPVFLDGALPVAPSAIAPQGRVSLLRPEKPYVTPRALLRTETAGSYRGSPTGLRMRSWRVSTAWSSTQRTAICSISSCRMAATCVMTIMVAP